MVAKSQVRFCDLDFFRVGIVDILDVALSLRACWSGLDSSVIVGLINGWIVALVEMNWNFCQPQIGLRLRSQQVGHVGDVGEKNDDGKVGVMLEGQSGQGLGSFSRPCQPSSVHGVFGPLDEKYHASVVRHDTTMT